jgi:chromate transporter
VALLFLRLGVTAFGGPAAHIAMMEDEAVLRRGWLTREQFLDLFGAASLIPGPSSTELAIYLGFRRAGWIGLLLGGACFILPAALLSGGFAWAYVRYGSLPQVAGILYGIKPIVIALVAQALFGLGKSALKTPLLAIIGLAALVAGLFEVPPLAILVVAAVIVALLRAGGLRAVAPLSIFLVFAKIGALVFGSGYVLLAFLRDELIARRHWLTEPQLLDAVAVGQFTPGPVFSTATFIGYLLGGGAGAVAATIGIFLPGFVLVAISGPLLPRVRESPMASAALDGVNVASLGLMAAVAWQLARSAIVDIPTALCALVAAVLLFVFRVNSAWLVFGGALVGLLLHR